MVRPQRQQAGPDRSGRGDDDHGHAEGEQGGPVREQHAADRGVAVAPAARPGRSALRSGISSESSAAASEKPAAIANTHAQAGDVDHAGAEQRADEDADPLAAAERGQRAGAVGRRHRVDDEALAGDQEHRPRCPGEHHRRAQGEHRRGRGRPDQGHASSTPAKKSARRSPIRATSAPDGSEASRVPTPIRPTTSAAVLTSAPRSRARSARTGSTAPVPDRVDDRSGRTPPGDVTQPELLVSTRRGPHSPHPTRGPGDPGRQPVADRRARGPRAARGARPPAPAPCRAPAGLRRPRRPARRRSGRPLTGFSRPTRATAPAGIRRSPVNHATYARAVPNTQT